MKVYIDYDEGRWLYLLRSAATHERVGSFTYRTRAVEWAKMKEWTIVRPPRKRAALARPAAEEDAR